MIKGGIVEKVFQYRRGNVWKQGFLSMFTQSHWIVYEGGLSFYNAANKPVKEIGKATMLVFKFATWGKNPEESLELLTKKHIGYIFNALGFSPSANKGNCLYL